MNRCMCIYIYREREIERDCFNSDRPCSCVEKAGSFAEQKHTNKKHANITNGHK